MEYKSDFIEREIQKITLFLRSAIGKIANEITSDFSLDLFDKELKGKLDFGFYELLELNDAALKKKLDGVAFTILEDLVKLFYEISKTGISNSANLKSVSLFIIHTIETESMVFSLERQHIKNYFKSLEIPK